MTTNTNWRGSFKKTKLATQGGSCWECCDYEGILKDMEDFITQCLKDQKAELLEALPKEKEYPFFSYESGYGLNDAKDEGFNDCLEIIKGLIKGDD